MARLVMKFGGTSVADIDRIRNVARHVKREVDAGHEVAVVVSAMAGKTNELVAWAREAAPLHDAREYDAVVASGEQVTAGLLAIMLEGMGVNARSWQGWQLPILTSNAHAAARIEDINGDELIKRFRERKEVAVVAGFQGVNKGTGRITTLGRGGSDTSAVAIAAAIRADRCDIYTDVDGVYTTDPRVVPHAQRLEKIAFEEMLEMASLGAKVMQVRSIELGMVHNVRIFVRSSFDRPEDIDPMSNHPPGTLICDESEIMEQQVVTGIAFSKDEAQISIRHVPDKPGVAAAIFGPLAEANVNVDMIVQNISADGSTTDLTFTVPSSDYERANVVLKKSKDAIGYASLDGSTDVAKVSVIGIGMRSHAGVAAQAFKSLAEKKINIRAITTSEIKFSLLIDVGRTDEAVRTLHSLYGLDKNNASSCPAKAGQPVNDANARMRSRWASRLMPLARLGPSVLGPALAAARAMRAHAPPSPLLRAAVRGLPSLARARRRARTASTSTSARAIRSSTTCRSRSIWRAGAALPSSRTPRSQRSRARCGRAINSMRACAARRPAKRRCISSANFMDSRPPLPSTRRPPRKRSTAVPKPSRCR